MSFISVWHVTTVVSVVADSLVIPKDTCQNREENPCARLSVAWKILLSREAATMQRERMDAVSLIEQARTVCLKVDTLTRGKEREKNVSRKNPPPYWRVPRSLARKSFIKQPNELSSRHASLKGSFICGGGGHFYLLGHILCMAQ